MKRIVFWMVALLLMSGVAMAQGNRQVEDNRWIRKPVRNV